MSTSSVRLDRQPMTVPEPSVIWAWLRARWRAVSLALRQPEVRVMWGVVLLAAVLRLSALDLIEFKADEANHLVRGLEIVEQGRLPLVGSPSSFGPAKPPMMTYLMALPLALGRDPRYAAAFIALLNVAAVGGTYAVARRYYGARVALIAALLFAVNPWAVVLSRKVFTADLLAPMAVLLFSGLLAAVVDRRPWGWVLSAVALALMLLTTFSPAPLVVVLAIVVAAYWRRVRWPYLLLGVLLAVVLASPYLYYLNLTRLKDVRDAVQQLLESSGATAGRGPSLLPLDLATRLHSGGGIEALGGQASADLAAALGMTRYPARVFGAVFIVSLPLMLALALRAWAHWREGQDPAIYVVPALWLWVPLLLLALWDGRVAQHYLVILYPIGFVAMGLTVDRLLAAVQSSSRRGWSVSLCLSGAAWAFLLVLAGLQAYGVMTLYRFVASHDTTGGHGVPLLTWQRTADMVRREMRAAGADQVWVLGNGVDPGFETEPAVLNYLLSPDVRVAFLGQGGHEALLLPAERPGLYLITRSADRAVQALEEMGGEVRGLVTLPEERAATRVMAIPQRSAAEVLSHIPNRGLWKLDTGMHLLGYEWPLSAQPGQRITLAAYWALLDVPPEARAHQHSLFNHLMAGDRRVAQVDGLGLPERSWQDGLVLLQWFEMELPQDLEGGEYTLLTGMYSLDDMTRSQVLGSGATGDAVALGPVRVGE
jgi:4-amino-4-deoxy-L-arabinose transferase-like glycosyltransferase